MRILIAESERVQRRLLEATLESWGYEVVSCSDGNEAWSRLVESDGPQLAILSWMLQGIDGVELCRRLRRARRQRYVYAMLLTSRGTREDVVQGLRAGADDYLIKPFDRQELRARLWVGRRILALQEKMLAVQQELKVQAERDPLTHQLNRGAILKLLQDELARSQRLSTPLAIGLGDLDYFKRVNDTFGHLVGDRVLTEAGTRMAALLGPDDGLGRYGGEEFLIVWPGSSLAGAHQAADGLRRSVSEQAIELGDVSCQVTISFGVAAVAAGRMADVDALIRDADRALYRAKREGRDRVVPGYALWGPSEAPGMEGDRVS